MLRFTMEALARIEEDFGQPLSEIGLRLMRDPRIRDMQIFLHRMLEAGGWEGLTLADIRKAQVDPDGLAIAIAESLGTMGGGDGTAEEAPGKPETPGMMTIRPAGRRGIAGWPSRSVSFIFRQRSSGK